MKLCRFSMSGRVYHGIIRQQKIIEIRSPFADQPVRTGRSFNLESVRLLPPSQPTKIVAAGVNYRAHAEDGHRLPTQPLIFLKPPTSITGHRCQIPYPALSRRIDFEGELGVVIRRRAEHISSSEAPAYILGYCCANDVTARDIQEAEDNNFGSAKSFNGFAPFGPWIETDINPNNLRIETRVNGEIRQQACTSDLLFSIPQLVSYISRIMPLMPGDLILTGTPRGMGQMYPGDEVAVHIDGIGTLSNHLGPDLSGPQDGLATAADHTCPAAQADNQQPSLCQGDRA